MSDLTLGDLESRVLRMTPEEFVSAHPHYILVWEESSQLDRDAGFATTALGSIPDFSPQGILRQWIVFEVAKSDRNNFKNMVTIGRTDNNDIVIKEGSVSKFHAYLSQALKGGFKLTDAGSRNGSSISAGNVLAHQSAPIVSGETITLGRVSLKFFSPDDFHKHIHQLKSEGAL